MRSTFMAFVMLFTFAGTSVGAQSSKELGASICSVFEEGIQISSSPTVIDRYIRENLSARAESEALLPAYEAIFHVSKDDRYEVFQKSVKEVTGTHWDCPAFKVLME